MSDVDALLDTLEEEGGPKEAQGVSIGVRDAHGAWWDDVLMRRSVLGDRLAPRIELPEVQGEGSDIASLYVPREERG